MKRWTKDEVQYLKDNYATKTVKQIAAALNRSKNSVDDKSFRLGLSKNTVRNGEWHLINLDGRKLWIRHAKGVVYRHREEWVKVNGEIPKGSHLRCKGDSSDYSPDNWFLVTKKEHAMLCQNPEKASKTAKANWKRVKFYEYMGMRVNFSKYRSKQIKTHTPVLQHAPNSHTTVSNI